MAGIGSAAVALMASCICNRKNSLGPLHLVHVPRYILYIYNFIYIYWNCSIKLQNKKLKHGEVVGNDACGVSLCLKSHLLQKAPSSRSSESLDRHSNLDIFLFEKKWKRHESSIRFDSIRQISLSLPQRIRQKHTKALPRVLLLLYNPPLEPRHHWRKLCKPRRMDLVRFQTKLQMCLWTIEDAATSFRI